MTRYDRLVTLKNRAWFGLWNYAKTDRAISWWARWWYKLDDAVHAERWKGLV